MKNKNVIYLTTIAFLVLLFIASPVIFKVYNIDLLPSQFFGALIGVFITALVTSFLLKGQTEGDEKREKSIKVFEKKQDVYHVFLQNLNEVIKDGEITISAQTRGEGEDEDVDELKDLLFQLGYIQLHTSEENTNKVFEKVAKIIRILNDFNAESTDKEKLLPQFYADLSEELFGIVAIFKNDLYGVKTDPIPKDKIENLLKECGLFVN